MISTQITKSFQRSFFANKAGKSYYLEHANRQKCSLRHFLGKINQKLAYFSKNCELIRLRRDILFKMCLIMNSKDKNQGKNDLSKS